MVQFDGLAEFEQVVLFSDRSTGLEGVIAIHSTALGPALGGLRARAYASRGDMLDDVLRLSRGMTYKAAAAGLDLGGGKAVVNCDPKELSGERLEAFGGLVESLGGRYITAEDVGTTTDHMVRVARETSHVVGLPADHGGLGDPSPSTALGVLASMKAALAEIGMAGLAGRTVAVSGVGKVGAALSKLLVAEGATVLVADVDGERVEQLVRELGVKPIDVEEVHRVEVDVFAPCALGAVLTQATIGELRCAAVVGAANNQLYDASCAESLRARGIVYVPDFVANAGGLIHVATEAADGDIASVEPAVLHLQDRVRSILRLSSTSNVSSQEAAEQLAEARIAAAPPTPTFSCPPRRTRRAAA